MTSAVPPVALPASARSRRAAGEVFALILQAQLGAQAASGLVGRAAAFDNAFWWSIGLTALAIIPALFLPGTKVVAAQRTEQAEGLAS